MTSTGKDVYPPLGLAPARAVCDPAEVESPPPTVVGSSDSWSSLTAHPGAPTRPRLKVGMGSRACGLMLNHSLSGTIKPILGHFDKEILRSDSNLVAMKKQ